MSQASTSRMRKEAGASASALFFIRSASSSASAPLCLLLATLCLAVLGLGCTQPEPAPERLLYTFQGTTMGTYYVAKVVQSSDAPLDEETQEGLLQQIEQELEAVNQAMSTYLDDSELSLFNAAPADEPFQLTDGTFEVFQASLEMAELTDGALDITIGPLVNAWGFGPDFSTPPTMDRDRLAELMAQVGIRHLSLDASTKTATKSQESLYCDLSSLAKGFAVDRVIETLRDGGHPNVMVEVGGEVRATGVNLQGRAWRLGIENPGVAGRAVQRIVALDDKAMATSGDYRNYREHNGVRLSHLIDPRTGRPIDHRLASVSVVHDDCMRADALATAFMILGPDEGLALAERENIAALFLIRDGEQFVEKASSAFAQAHMPSTETNTTNGNDPTDTETANADAPSS